MPKPLDKPFGHRLAAAIALIVLYGLLWAFGLWRPLDEWVHAIVVGAILVSWLTPMPIRPFVALASWLAVAAVFYFVVRMTPLQVGLLLIFGAGPSALDALAVVKRGGEKP